MPCPNFYVTLMWCNGHSIGMELWTKYIFMYVYYRIYGLDIFVHVPHTLSMPSEGTP